MDEVLKSGQLPWASILEICSDEIYVFETDGKIIYTNEAAKRESGYNFQEESVNILDIFPKYFGMSNHMIVVLDKGKELEREVFAYRKNQTCYPVKTKFVWENGGLKKLGVFVATNISEVKSAIKREKLAKAELEDANGVKNMFLANVTHELRTPVNGMKGLADILMETDLTASQRENVKIIRRCCDNMTNLINEILDFTKITAKKLELEEVEFDFSQFIKNIIAVHMSLLNQKGLKLQVNIGEDVPAIIYGDELRLGQILNNLISNAIKFTQVGSIAVEVVNTFEDEETIELFFMVIDSGIGIAKEEMDKLFLSFSQVDGSITRKFGGTGLGLAISKKLVELMGGTVNVNSEKGKGSTFSFSVRFKKKKSDGHQEIVPTAAVLNEIKVETNPIKEKLREPSQERKEETLDVNNMLVQLEKLGICIELGIWEKAETYAALIKHMIPESLVELRKQAFRVELAVRKEDYNLSKDQLEKSYQMVTNQP
jgi:signal transduction histidine kinase